MRLSYMYLLEIAGRSLAVYVAVLVLLRFGGRRELAQLTPGDLVVMILIANGVQNAMVGPDTSLEGGIVAAATLVGANWLVSHLRARFPRFEAVLAGRDLVLFHDGDWDKRALLRAGLRPDDVIDSMDDVFDQSKLRDVWFEPKGVIRYETADGQRRRMRPL
jgi:uncharacterized membrane protein YcaP (DUF421 family)